MSSELLRIENLTRRLEGEVPVTLVREANMSVRLGEFLVITGPSGSGKSSLLYLLGLLDVPSSGRMWLAGSEITSFDENALAQIRLRNIGFVFQSHFLLPEFNALENVMLPMQKLKRLTATKMKSRAQDLLAQLGLADQMKKLPKQLSGGQSQRVAIARALANEPSLILADEPSGNLDTQASANVQKILQDLAGTGEHAVLVVTHDVQFAAQAQRTVRVVDGVVS